MAERMWKQRESGLCPGQSNVFCDRLKKLGEKLFVSQRVFQEDFFSGIVRLDLRQRGADSFAARISGMA